MQLLYSKARGEGKKTQQEKLDVITEIIDLISLNKSPFPNALFSTLCLFLCQTLMPNMWHKLGRNLSLTLLGGVIH